MVVAQPLESEFRKTESDFFLNRISRYIRKNKIQKKIRICFFLNSETGDADGGDGDGDGDVDGDADEDDDDHNTQLMMMMIIMMVIMMMS